MQHFLRFFDSTLGASVVALLVLAIKKLLHGRLSARIHHALWLIVLIRLLLPVFPNSPVSIFNVMPFDMDSIFQTVKKSVSTIASFAGKHSPAERNTNQAAHDSQRNDSIILQENRDDRLKLAAWLFKERRGHI